MSYVARSDAELLAFAREGVASAFAVLLYRHGPEILELAQRDPDPVGAVVATYIRAMRALPNADPGDVRLWLLGFAAEEIEGEVDIPAAPTVGAAAASGGHSAAATGGAAPQASNGTARAVSPGRGPMDAPPLETDDDLDEVWAELALRWPTGRAPRHLPSWAIWVITTIVLIALAILLPWAVLGASGDDAEAIEELSASPVLEDLTIQDEDDEDDVEEQELPTFDFPEPPDAEPESTQDTAPPPEPEPDTTEDADAVEELDDPPGDDAADGTNETDGETNDGTDDGTEDDTDDETGDDTGDETEDDTADEGTEDEGDDDPVDDDPIEPPDPGDGDDV